MFWVGNSESHVRVITCIQVENRCGVSSHMSDISCTPSVQDTRCSMHSSNVLVVQVHTSSSNVQCTESFTSCSMHINQGTISMYGTIKNNKPHPTFPAKIRV